MAELRQFAHCVYFQLKDNSPAAKSALLAGCDQYLTGHPGTVFYSAGLLADCQRPVNDRNFDVALVMVFADRAAHDAYQVAERHNEFIKAFRDNWQQVRVFDADVA
jgi:hypothetical protein